jgi:4-diphosphocytidyl-2-C-methyl-D-erythritol kinase
MQAVAQQLGSDVPFFLFAPAAVVSGRGEIVKPASVDESRWVVLVKPEFGVETKWAYEQLAATRAGVQPLSAAQTAMDRHRRINWSEVAAAAENDFETPVFARHSVLLTIKDTLRKQGAECALLSGSGATVFGIFADESNARRVQAHFAHDGQLQVFVVATCSEPVTVS